MYLDQYLDLTDIKTFMGLYSRGGNDNCPQDHSAVFQNFTTRGKRGEFNFRNGSKQSLNITHAVVRMFEAKFINNVGVLSSNFISCDGAGNIWKQDNTLLINIPNMIDFVALNLFNHVFILPICSVFGASVLQVWDGTNPVRPALGSAPGAGMAVAQAAGGNITPGVHQFAVAFVTNTGFTTPPGPVVAGVFTPVSVTFSTGNGTANVTGIPTGPAGTVQRLLFATKSGLGTYYFIPAADGGLINDNVTTTATLNFFDTDLAIDATSLFALRTSIPSATTDYGGAGLAVYRGRLIILDGTTTNQINVSDSGLPENFDSVHDFITVDYQQDQFISAFEYFGTLYISGNTGIHATSDNGGNPSTWSVNLIDSGNGFNHAGLINVLSEKYAGPLGSIMLGVFREGLYLFNGNVNRPCLSLKIQNIFDTFTHGKEHSPHLVVDLTQDILYILIPTGGSSIPNTLIVGDFSDGLSAESIIWSTFTFTNFSPRCLQIADFNDGDDFDYWLRMGTTAAGIQKLTPKVTNDSGNAIVGQIQFSNFGPSDGTLSIFRFLRSRVTGSGTIQIQLQDRDGNNVVNPPSWTLAASGGDQFRQINYTAEGMQVLLTISTLNASVTMDRFDCFAKRRWMTRPG